MAVPGVIVGSNPTTLLPDIGVAPTDAGVIAVTAALASVPGVCAGSVPVPAGASTTLRAAETVAWPTFEPGVNGMVPGVAV
jgi:hypothetical protein